ncbi:phytanoyl-CoA dioxygenase [Aureococcus anophagefferens]|nr:phytanoyl-CoA dioxygenase [Aureococcus anophagefferens]
MGRRAPACDWDAYADRYPDVRAAFGRDARALAAHYDAHGAGEGRHCAAHEDFAEVVDLEGLDVPARWRVLRGGTMEIVPHVFVELRGDADHARVAGHFCGDAQLGGDCEASLRAAVEAAASANAAHLIATQPGTFERRGRGARREAVYADAAALSHLLARHNVGLGHSHFGAAMDERKVHGQVWQWALLDLALDAFGARLEAFDVLVRTRTDLDERAPLPYASLRPAPGAVHCRSDFVFYGARGAFLAAFGPMFRRVLGVYWRPEGGREGQPYVPIDWGALLESDLSGVKWWWLPLPLRIFGDARPATPLDLKLFVADHLRELGAVAAGAPARLSYFRAFNSEASVAHQVLATPEVVLCAAPTPLRLTQATEPSNSRWTLQRRLHEEFAPEAASANDTAPHCAPGRRCSVNRCGVRRQASDTSSKTSVARRKSEKLNVDVCDPARWSSMNESVKSKVCLMAAARAATRAHAHMRSAIFKGSSEPRSAASDDGAI